MPCAHVAAIASALISAACGSLDLIAAAVPAPEGDAGTAPPAIPWGVYAASLDLPACPPSEHPPLVVDTTSGDMDLPAGELVDPSLAGAELSFPEALAIAGFRTGLDTILFDVRAFPPEAPATVEVPGFDGGSRLASLCIDGRSRGVIMVGGRDPVSYWELSFSTLLGLTLTPQAYIQVLVSRVAGCRVEETLQLLTFTGEDGELVVGPHNVLTAPHVSLDLGLSMGRARVVGNDIGVDPLLQIQRELPYACRVSSMTGDLRVEDNRIAIAGSVFADEGPARGLVTLSGNAIGAAAAMTVAWQEPLGGVELPGGDFTIGPGNIIQGVAVAVYTRPATRARITRNRITANQVGIAHAVAPVAPPTLTAAAPTVRGTCPVAGHVEVFADPADQGALFLGEADCAAGGSWSVDAAPPDGLSATATLTDADGRTSAFSLPLSPP